jgi:hypothetical protein
MEEPSRSLWLDVTSGAAAATYVALKWADFPGDWLVLYAAMGLFAHVWFERYRRASEVKRRRYFAVAAGFLLLFPCSWLFISFLALLPWDARAYGLSVFPFIDVAYLVIALPWLHVIDRMKPSEFRFEVHQPPNKSVQPTPGSVTPRATESSSR